MPTNNPGSARMTFQWKYMDEYYATHEKPGPDIPPAVLNVGSADDPLEFGELAVHFDIDDWSYKHKWFKQGNAEHMPYSDESFDLVILGDMLEHVDDIPAVIKEACRIVRIGGKLILTVFEEWRLPGVGQWVKEGKELGDKVSREMGYADRQDFQVKNFPDRKGFDDDQVSHLVHINQFDQEDIQTVMAAIEMQGFKNLEALYAFEVKHEGHDIYNWLLAFERLS